MKLLDRTSFASPLARTGDTFGEKRRKVLDAMTHRGLDPISFTETVVVPHHIDFMGHIANAHYPTFFQVSHNRLLCAYIAEFTNEEFASAVTGAHGIAPVPIQISTAFRLPVGFPDAIITGGRFAKVDDKIWHIVYEAFSLASGQHVATFDVINRLVDLKTGRAIRISESGDQWRRLHRGLESKAAQSLQTLTESSAKAAREISNEAEEVKKGKDRRTTLSKL